MMERLFITLIAAVGTVWKIDPATRPLLDVVIWLLCVVLALVLGARFDAWLDRLARRPRRHS